MFDRPSKELVEAGIDFMSSLYNASIRKSLGVSNLGGCKCFDENDFPEDHRELINAYINEEICSVEACFIYMRSKA
jgi:hypothetical protein